MNTITYFMQIISTIIITIIIIIIIIIIYVIFDSRLPKKYRKVIYVRKLKLTVQVTSRCVTS